MNIKQLIRDRITQVLPDFGVDVTNGMLKGDDILIMLTLGKDRTEYTNGIKLNDCLNILLYITVHNNYYDIEKEYSYYKTIPTNKYLHHESVKIPFRMKRNINLDKLLLTLENYTIKLKEMLISEYNNNNLLPYDHELIYNKLIKELTSCNH